MPELPEVETIRRGLAGRVSGQRILEIRIGDKRVLRCDASDLAETVVGQSIVSLARRGKFLVFELETEFLVIHLGMTGQLTFRDPERPDCKAFVRHPITGLQRALQHPPDKHTHLQILLEDGGALFFRDVRKFGKIYLLRPQQKKPFFERLGLEPFGENYVLENFLDRFRGRTLKVKSLLLDQGFVAGVGNIYADEALFEAALHPARTVRSLRRYEKVRLFEAIPKVLRKGIHFGGTSLRDYVDSEGRRGTHQERLMVYGRDGLPCRRCGVLLERIVISQRGTHFCPRCQPRRARSATRKRLPETVSG